RPSGPFVRASASSAMGWRSTAWCLTHLAPCARAKPCPDGPRASIRNLPLSAPRAAARVGVQRPRDTALPRHGVNATRGVAEAHWDLIGDWATIAFAR